MKLAAEVHWTEQSVFERMFVYSYVKIRRIKTITLLIQFWVTYRVHCAYIEKQGYVLGFRTLRLK